MLDNIKFVKVVARWVFPDMGAFSHDLWSKIGQWGAYITTGKDAVWFTVRSGRDLLYSLEASKGVIKASYALPAVLDLGDSVFEYGTKLANSRARLGLRVSAGFSTMKMSLLRRKTGCWRN